MYIIFYVLSLSSQPSPLCTFEMFSAPTQFKRAQWGSPGTEAICADTGCKQLYIYRKVPSERPHPCNRPPRIFFRLKDWYRSSAPPPPPPPRARLCLCRATDFTIRVRSHFAKMSRQSSTRRTPWSTSSGCFAGIKIMVRTCTPPPDTSG